MASWYNTGHSESISHNEIIVDGVVYRRTEPLPTFDINEGDWQGTDVHPRRPPRHCSISNGGYGDLTDYATSLHETAQRIETPNPSQFGRPTMHFSDVVDHRYSDKDPRTHTTQTDGCGTYPMNQNIVMDNNSLHNGVPREQLQPQHQVHSDSLMHDLSHRPQPGQEHAFSSVPAGWLQKKANDEANRANKIWNSYLCGQSCNVAKVAVWWSMFGTLVTSLLNSDAAIGASRVPFNVALVLASPLAGAVAERARVRTSLNVTTFGRMAVWTFLVPATWIVTNNYYKRPDLFWWIFLSLMFIDGVHVAFANVVDIDCGGLETISVQYDLPINDHTRNTFNSVHQMVFDLSFVLFTPPIAFLLLELARLLGTRRGYLLGDDPGTAALLLGICVAFLLLSSLSLWRYAAGLPKETARQTDGGNEVHPLEEPGTVRQKQPSLWAETKERVSDVVQGFHIVRQDKALGWRLIFLAFETALEDSMVSVVIPHIAIHGAAIFPSEGHAASYNVWAVCVIATGKIGGLISGLYMGTQWNPPVNFDRSGAYRPLFWCVLWASASLFLFPLSFHLSSSGLASPLVCGILIFLGSFLFFAFSTAPKIGFATLLQNLVAGPQVTGPVFGFVGTFVTIVDAFAILLVNSVFVVIGPKSQRMALLAVAGIYLLHGLAEAFAGPNLVLERTPPSSSRNTQSPDQPFPLASISQNTVGFAFGDDTISSTSRYAR